SDGWPAGWYTYARRGTPDPTAGRAAHPMPPKPETMDFDHVEVNQLMKVFGLTRALAGVSLRFDAGQVSVVEGPNGSGKSTLLSILAQLARPTSGKVRYGRYDSRRHGAGLRGRIGVLGHAAMVYPDLTARENLEFFRRMHGLEPDAVSALIDRFEIGRFGDRAVRTYSRGQLQRVALARALLHRPRLVLLDEPSTGLDLRAVDRLVEAVGVERERGAILVLVTHDSGLAEALADVRIRLERGRLAEAA
ncbi:MAG: heme ABC exporter ATP-binding protein CcmA, partial [Myxococcales bacterium]|nr:heme ABC exporter ATP-binding protein CcmA [Myxococcales bacterium]